MKMIPVYTGVSETISVYTTQPKTHVTSFMQVQLYIYILYSSIVNRFGLKRLLN